MLVYQVAQTPGILVPLRLLPFSSYTYMNRWTLLLIYFASSCTWTSRTGPQVTAPNSSPNAGLAPLYRSDNNFLDVM